MDLGQAYEHGQVYFIGSCQLGLSIHLRDRGLQWEGLVVGGKVLGDERCVGVDGTHEYQTIYALICHIPQK